MATEADEIFSGSHSNWLKITNVSGIISVPIIMV
jgi:hypothetical protein